MKKLNIEQALAQLTKPQHPVLVVSGNISKKVNIMVAEWVMRTSLEPPMMAVSVGFSRFTHQLLEEFDEFVLAYPTKSQEEIIKYCGSTSGRVIDKFSEIGIKTCTSEKVHLPLLEEARVNFECKTVGKFATGDHTIFVGEVTSASGNAESKAFIDIGNRVYREFS